MSTLAQASAPHRWLILATVLMGSLVGTLGNSMANVALPAIMDHFAVEISSATWVITIYIPRPLLVLFILQSASSPSNLGALRLDFYLLIAVASAAALLTFNLPGPIACQSPSDQNE